MEKKFTRAMVCEEFKSTCGKCPLHSDNNPKSLPCWLLNESDIQNIMEDYPYADVKARIIFNDIETRLTEVEKKVSNDVKFTFKPGRIIFGSTSITDGFSAEVVDKKLYDKLEAKHEADCRLISEYDLEIKRLGNEIRDLNKHIAAFSLACDLYKKENENLKSDVERDHYKGLYSSKCDDYDKLLEKQLKTQKDFTFYRNAYYECCSANDDHIEKERDLKEELNKLKDQKDRYKNLFHSLNHNYLNVVGVMKYWKEKYETLVKENKRLTESNDTATKENLEFEGENDALSTRNAFLEDKIEEQKTRIASLESKLRNQRANLASLQEKYEDAVKMNKAREEVFEANIKLQKTIESKDREINLLRAELDKYKTDECDDRWID